LRALVVDGWRARRAVSGGEAIRAGPRAGGGFAHGLHTAKDGQVVSPALGYQTRESVAVIALAHPAVAGSVLTLRSRSERALAANSRVLAIDLRAADPIDTQTLTELCATLRTIGRHNATLAVVSTDPRVRWVLALCDIDKLELHPTIRSALARGRAVQRKLKRPSRPGVPSPRRLARRDSSARS